MPKPMKGHDTGELPAETTRKIRRIPSKAPQRGEPDAPRAPRKRPVPQRDPLGEPLGPPLGK